MRAPLCHLMLGFVSCLSLVGCAGVAARIEAPATGRAEPAQAAPIPAPRLEQSALPTFARIGVFFKLDPALTRGLSMGDRWVSRPTFKQVRQPGRRGSVQARAEGQDSRGRRRIRHLQAEWVPADPEMVTVTPGLGKTVTIEVHGPGQSTLEVRAEGVSQMLRIEATYQPGGDLTELVLTQAP